MLPSGSLTIAMVVPGLMVVLGRVKAMCAASNRWITSARLVTTKVRKTYWLPGRIGEIVGASSPYGPVAGVDVSPDAGVLRPD